MTISAVLQTISLHDSSLKDLRHIPDDKIVLMSIDLCSQDPNYNEGNPIPGILKFEGVEELKFERQLYMTEFSEILDVTIRESSVYAHLECAEILIEDQNEYVTIWITASELSWNPA